MVGYAMRRLCVQTLEANARLFLGSIRTVLQDYLKISAGRELAVASNRLGLVEAILEANSGSFTIGFRLASSSIWEAVIVNLLLFRGVIVTCRAVRLYVNGIEYCCRHAEGFGPVSRVTCVLNELFI